MNQPIMWWNTKNPSLIIILCILLLVLFITSVKDAKISGYRLLIYYGTPEGVNQVWDPMKAAEIFINYDYVVFGDQLQFLDNHHHLSTVKVIKRMREIKPNMKIFGYVDLGVTTENHSLSEIRKRIELWQAAGANGIFLDDAGFDYEVSRARLNEAIHYSHKLHMPVFINAWNPEDVMSSTAHAIYNPGGEKSLISNQDYYLLEDFLQPVDIKSRNQSNVFNEDFRHKLDQLRMYRNKLGVRLMSISIIDYEAYDLKVIHEFFRMNEAAAAIFSLDGYGISPVHYSSSDISTDIVLELPYITNYMEYYNPQAVYTYSASLNKHSRQGFRIQFIDGQHNYSYPDDADVQQ